jgi:predicted Zn-dependent protease
VNLRQDYALAFYALGEVLAQKGLRKEAAAVLRTYLAKEKDTPDTHHRVERARARLKELES